VTQRPSARRTPAPSTDARRDLSRLEDRIGHVFRDCDLLVRALTHSSRGHESGTEDNEALEFLGDAALGFMVAQALLRRFPTLDEGGLSKLKAFLVSRPNLATAARSVGLGRHLRLGRTAAHQAARARDSILADALEAVIAAVLLDGGDDAARKLIVRLFGSQIDGLRREDVEGKDHKTALQEWLQAKGRATPRYQVVATEGPAHNPVFQVGLSVEGQEVARGRGGTKKEAEQRAARLALRVLRKPRTTMDGGDR
jgi:ribonuclease-3